VITFDAHPEEVVAGLAPPLLCDPDERLARLAAAGVEVIVVQHFDHALRVTTYGEFVERIRAKVEVAGFAMTADAAFGYERAGLRRPWRSWDASLGSRWRWSSRSCLTASRSAARRSGGALRPASSTQRPGCSAGAPP